jgi:hypothetical protein
MTPKNSEVDRGDALRFGTQAASSCGRLSPAASQPHLRLVGRLPMCVRGERAAPDAVSNQVAGTHPSSRNQDGKQKPPIYGVSERMMGLEPTTFCMASASDRSRPFAQSACFGGVGFDERTRMNPERTPNLAILATPARDKTSRKPVLGLGR